MTVLVIRNPDGVAGFFEDLPVLMTVLLGVAAIVFAGTWVAKQNQERSADEELSEVAGDICRAVLTRVAMDLGDTPRLSSLADVDFLQIGEKEARGHSFSVTVAMLFPEQRIVASAIVGDPSDAISTGFACLPFNALDDHGLSVPMEVRTIAWQGE